MNSGNSQTVTLSTSSARAAAPKELHAFSKSHPGTQECVLGTGTSKDQAHLCASGWCCHKLHVGISSCPCSLLVSLTGQSQTHQLKCCSSICTPWRHLLCQHSVACSWEEISGYLVIKSRVSDLSKIYMWLSKASMLQTGSL